MTTQRKYRPRGQLLRGDIGYLGERARPGCALRYTVVGRGKFPDDMLRYDDARILSPSEAQGADNTAEFFRVPREVRIVHAGGVTPARWLSFGWSVCDDIEEYANEQA